MKINETLNQSRKYFKEKIRDRYYEAEFSLDSDLDIYIEVSLMSFSNDSLDVDFSVRGEDSTNPNKSRETYTIFATVSQIVMDHIQEHPIKNIFTTASSKKRADIFEKMLRRLEPDWEIERFGDNVEAERKN